MTPWADAVRAVLHVPTCGVNVNPSDDSPYCTCDRDARIGRGIAAARESDSHYEAWHCGSDGPPCRCGATDKDAAALAAFTEAT